MKQEITIEVEIPEGYEYVRYGHVAYGEYFLERSNDLGFWCQDSPSSGIGVILKKKPVEIFVGDEYKYDDGDTAYGATIYTVRLVAGGHVVYTWLTNGEARGCSVPIDKFLSTKALV